ncbi:MULTISPECIES: hypothetical protein [unclassified Microbacterium]|uniref:hypothetical protein n=1 Tax=unclassified Microbacterium TaxID=2609290 RepID=UPI00300FC72D
MNTNASRALRGPASWAITAALLAVGGVVVALTPPEHAGEEPFPVVVEIGERGVGRNIDVTVHDVRRVRELSEPPDDTSYLPRTPWTATGNWVVVDLDAAAVVQQVGAQLGGAFLEIDGRTYQATERPESLYRIPLVPGVPRSGSVAFELPDGLSPGRAVLAFSATWDPRVDSQIRVPIDLSDVSVQDSGVLRPSEWATP